MPADEEAREALRALKEGQEIVLDVRANRNPGHHRKFFALLNLLVQNSDAFENIDQALLAVKIACHEIDVFIDPATGKTFYCPRSIAFEKMDQARFGRLYDRAIHVICTRWLAGTDQEGLRREVEAIIDGPAAIGQRAA